MKRGTHRPPEPDGEGTARPRSHEQRAQTWWKVYCAQWKGELIDGRGSHVWAVARPILVPVRAWQEMRAWWPSGSKCRRGVSRASMKHAVLLLLVTRARAPCRAVTSPVPLLCRGYRM